CLVLLLAGASLLNIRNPLPVRPGNTNQALAYFGMSMFAFSAFFSVPQAVQGLNKDRKKIRKAVFIGIFVNYMLIIIISISALLASPEVTQIAIVGWSMGIGVWAEAIGSIFTLLAMLTTYWSISLALGDIIREQLKLDKRLCWVLATLPSLLFTMFSGTSFFDIMRIAGGLIAIIIAVMVVPAYMNAKKEGGENILGVLSGKATEIFVMIMYVLTAVGNVVPV
ncbi:MAG: aromatic amino acid transport family protein, partial [Bullifex sp.]